MGLSGLEGPVIFVQIRIPRCRNFQRSARASGLVASGGIIHRAQGNLLTKKKMSPSAWYEFGVRSCGSGIGMK